LRPFSGASRVPQAGSDPAHRNEDVDVLFKVLFDSLKTPQMLSKKSTRGHRETDSKETSSTDVEETFFSFYY
jgi:hypothetical protein